MRSTCHRDVQVPTAATAIRTLSTSPLFRWYHFCRRLWPRWQWSIRPVSVAIVLPTCSARWFVYRVVRWCRCAYPRMHHCGDCLAWPYFSVLAARWQWSAACASRPTWLDDMPIRADSSIRLSRLPTNWSPALWWSLLSHCKCIFLWGDWALIRNPDQFDYRINFFFFLSHRKCKHREECPEYYRDVLAYGCGAASVLGIVTLLTLTCNRRRRRAIVIWLSA